MFGIGLPELVIILIVVLIVFGPKKLPDLARSLGKGMAEFKKVTDDFKANVGDDLREIKTDIEEVPKAALFNQPWEAPSEPKPHSEPNPPDPAESSANPSSANTEFSSRNDPPGEEMKGSNQ